MSGGSDEGQATVELALILPLLVLLLLGVLQVGLVARDAIAVSHATRAAARAVVVDPTSSAARDAATEAVALDSNRLDVEVTGQGRPGDRVEVRVRYDAPTSVPLIGAMLGDVSLEDRLVAMVE